MAKTPAIIHLLRGLVALLLVVMILFGVTIYIIQNESGKNILEASEVLRKKNRPLEILDQCIQQVYRIDNGFRLYTLSFSSASFDSYKLQLKRMDSLMVALQSAMQEADGDGKSVYAMQAGIRDKAAMQASFSHLRRIADSLLYTATSMQELHSGMDKAAPTAIRQYSPDLSVLSVDTLNVSSEQTKKKKGFFGKVKSFFKGETETTKTNKKVAVKSGTTGVAADTAAPLTLASVGMEVARQSNEYYELRLKEQYRLNMQIKEKERELVGINARLMESIAGVFTKLKQENLDREERVQNLAVVNIMKYSRIIDYCLLGSTVLAILLAILISLTIRRIIRYQRGIIAARKKAEDEALEKSRFLAFMSHELRTPLTSIIGFSEQLKESNLDPVQEGYVRAMSGSSDILLTTVNDILDLSKLDSGKFRFVKFSFAVKPVIEQVLNSLRPMATKKGLQLDLVVSTPPNLCYIGDEMRLKQVIINLVNNAIKYSEGGVITLTVSADKGMGKSTLQVDVADQGIGIDEDKLKDVFSEFSQVHEQNASKWIIGTGLGLPICKKIVEQQGGKIWVTSKKGVGSTFSFSIPYQAVAGKPEEMHKQEENIFDPELFKGKKILAADDTEINLVLLDSIFRKWGVVPDRARNGEEALRLFKMQAYDLVLSDVYMPEMDGIELTRQIRMAAPPANKKVPVIILSANMIHDEIEKYKLAGVTDYLPKPFAAMELYKVVSKQLRSTTL